MSASPAEHRAFLNRYYGISRSFYDVTRKYYLFGRDVALRDLVLDAGWRDLVEVGPGTGRNLRRLHRARPSARLGGVDASDAMLDHARERCAFATLKHGFAETAALDDVLEAPPDRVLFSYCLSMVGDPAAALANARRSVGEEGEVVVVDFADFAGLPSVVASPLRRWLATFHVRPLEESFLRDARSVRWGPGRYYVLARFGKSKG